MCFMSLTLKAWYPCWNLLWGHFLHPRLKMLREVENQKGVSECLLVQDMRRLSAWKPKCEELYVVSTCPPGGKLLPPPTSLHNQTEKVPTGDILVNWACRANYTMVLQACMLCVVVCYTVNAPVLHNTTMHGLWTAMLCIVKKCSLHLFFYLLWCNGQTIQRNELP